jgi:serine/threonine-protein kinase
MERVARGRVGITLLAKWKLDAVLGVGGMSAVYAATHRNGNRVAIKVLRSDLAENPSARARLLREAYAANRVAHAGGVAVLDDGVDGSLVFLVMELVEGQTLHAKTRSGKLSLDESLRIADELLAIVAVAHTLGIVHRDLKPENILLMRNGRVRVLDFGLASMSESPAFHVTQSHATLGTPAFMAPEQARGRMQDVDARTDIWAVGATMFACLSGRFVHAGDTINEMMIAAATRAAPSIARDVPELPRAVVEAIDRALAFRPEDRWQTALEMRNALRLARGLAPIEGASPSEATHSSPEQGPTTLAETQDGPRDRRDDASDTPPSAASIRRSMSAASPARARLGLAFIALVALVTGLAFVALRERGVPAPLEPPVSSPMAAEPTILQEPPLAAAVASNAPTAPTASERPRPPPMPRRVTPAVASPPVASSVADERARPATAAPAPSASASVESRSGIFERRK